MPSIVSGLAAHLLRITTTPAGESTLPTWIVVSLATLAGIQPPQGSKPGSINESLVWRAVTAYQAATGRRGQASVAAAWQKASDGTQAVLVLPQPQDEMQRQALLKLESLVQSTTINHPRLAPVFQTAFSQGYPYVAARLGQSAEALTKRFGLPMDPEQALRMTQQVAEALEYAHHRGLIHGSLGLDDILVTDSGQLTVLGVGVEQLRHLLEPQGPANVSTLASPEVVAGEEADARADVFAVGALLYVLLTGKMPAAGKPVALSQDIPAVPPAVDAVLTKSLAADPGDRYPDIFEMSRDLRMAIHSPRSSTKRMAPAKAAVKAAGSTAPPAGGPAKVVSHLLPAISGFPESLPMPVVDVAVFDQPLEMPEVASVEAVVMPIAPSMPKVDWNGLLRPVDLSTYGGLTIEIPHDPGLVLPIDPMLAAIQAVRAVESRPPSRKKPVPQPAPAAAKGTAATSQATQPQPSSKPKRKSKQ